jgi:hypothetical protein
MTLPQERDNNTQWGARLVPGDGARRELLSGLSSWLSGATGSRSCRLWRPKKRGTGAAGLEILPWRHGAWRPPPP